MIKPDVKNMAVTFGPCRLCYVHVLERHKFEGDQGEGKYSAIILIPKSEKATVEAVKQAIERAKEEGLTSKKWKGKIPGNYRDPLQDGDKKEDEVFHNHWYINAKSSSKPLVIDRNRQPITDPEDIYSGVWAVVSVSMFPYDKGGNGVGVSLAGVMKAKDGERIGGGTGAAAAAFERVELDDESDDEL